MRQLHKSKPYEVMRDTQLDLMSLALQAYLDHRCEWSSVLTFARALGYSPAFCILLSSRKEMIEYVAGRTRETKESSSSGGSDGEPASAPSAPHASNPNQEGGSIQ